jgi:hypothetical protein
MNNYQLLCGLERLKVEVSTKIKGLLSSFVLSNLRYVTSGIHQPFNRLAHSCTGPFQSYSPFSISSWRGLEYGQIQNEMVKIDEVYDYQHFHYLFEMLNEFF